jgi:hypothetical protein
VRSLDSAKNSLQLVGPLSGHPGTILSAREQHSGVMIGHGQLESTAQILREAADAVDAAVTLITGP